MASIVEEVMRLRRGLLRHRERYVRAWIAVTGLDPRDCELVEQVRGDGTAVWIESAAQPGPDLRAARARIAELEADLARYKAAVADRLHYDMQATLDGTPESHWRKRIASLEAELARVVELKAPGVDCPACGATWRSSSVIDAVSPERERAKAAEKRVAELEAEAERLRAFRDGAARLVGLVQPEVDPAGINDDLMLDDLRRMVQDGDRLRGLLGEMAGAMEGILPLAHGRAVWLLEEVHIPTGEDACRTIDRARDVLGRVRGGG